MKVMFFDAFCPLENFYLAAWNSPTWSLTSALVLCM